MRPRRGTEARGIFPISKRVIQATPRLRAASLMGVALAFVAGACTGAAAPASEESAAPTAAVVAVATPVQPTPQIHVTAPPSLPPASARPSPSSRAASTPAAAATRTETPVELTITSPTDGAASDVDQVTVSGTGPAGFDLIVINNHDGTYVWSDSSMYRVRAIDGRWSVEIDLTPGDNEITVGYAVATASDAVTVTHEPPPTPTPKPTAKPKPTATPKPVTYATLTSRQWAKVVKAPDAMTGKGYKVWACISQFDAATGPSTFLAQTSYRNETYWYTDGVNAIFTGDEQELAEFVEGDLVAISAMTVGSFSYDTQAGGTATVPQFFIAKIQHKGTC